MGIYIHIPFEDYKDKTFDYFTIENIDLEEYIQLILKEIYLYKDELKRVDWVYFGGGSPSSIDEKYIKKILEEIEKFWNIDDTEISLECEIFELDENKLKNYLNMGINRLSLRIRTLNEKELEFLNYPIKKIEMIKKINLAKKYFSNINIDIINPICINEAKFIKEIKEILNLDINHISFYQHLLNKGLDYWKIYLKFRKLLMENGYSPYHYLHFKKDEKTFKYQDAISNLEKFIAIGLSSSGYLKDYRYKNTLDYREYKNKILKDIEPRETINIKEEENKLEYIMLNLERLEGINYIKYYERFKINFLNEFEKELEELNKKNLININKNFVNLTEEGYLQLYEVIENFYK